MAHPTDQSNDHSNYSPNDHFNDKLYDQSNDQFNHRFDEKILTTSLPTDPSSSTKRCPSRELPTLCLLDTSNAPAGTPMVLALELDAPTEGCSRFGNNFSTFLKPFQSSGGSARGPTFSCAAFSLSNGSSLPTYAVQENHLFDAMDPESSVFYVDRDTFTLALPAIGPRHDPPPPRALGTHPLKYDHVLLLERALLVTVNSTTFAVGSIDRLLASLLLI